MTSAVDVYYTRLIELGGNCVFTTFVLAASVTCRGLLKCPAAIKDIFLFAVI